MKKEKSIAKNIVFKFILNLFNVVVPILIGPYVARKLGPEQMGVANFSQTIFGYFFIFAGFGVYQYGLREISRWKNDETKMRRTFTSLFVVTIISNVLSTLFYVFLIQTKYVGTNLYVPCMIFAFNLMANVFYVEWVNEALENFDFITIKTIIIKIIYTVLLFVMVRSADDLNEYIILLVGSVVLNNIASYIYIRRRIKFDFTDLRIFRHIKPMFLVVILSNVNVLYTQFDKLLLGEYLDMTQVAYYSIAQMITTMISGLMLTLVHVTIPRLTNYSGNNNEESYLKLLNKISKIYLMLLFPTCIGMFVLSKQIIVLYGSMEYIGATSVFSVFALYAISLGYESILTNQVMYIKRKEKQLVRIALIGGAFNVVANLILLNRGLLTPTTSIASTMIGNVILVVVENIYITRVLKVKFNIFSIDKFKYLIISLVFIPVTWAIRLVFRDLIIFTSVAIVINAAVYFMILLLLRDKLFIELINIILIKLKIKKA